MIPPFKKPRANLRDEAQFNSCLSSQRIVVEYAFGQLKARFPFLTSVSIPISDEASHQKVVQWFYIACIILHNYLLERQEDEWTEGNDVRRAYGLEAEIQLDMEERLRNRQRNEAMYREALGNEDETTREYLLGMFKRQHL